MPGRSSHRTMTLPNNVITKIDKITDAIIHIISISTRQLVLVSPYLQLEFSKTKQWTEFNDAIKGAVDRGVDVMFITRERDARNTKDSMTLLSEYRSMGCSVYCVDKLHAKIYYCETMALISSMNLTLSSTIKNYEIATVVHGSVELRALKDYIDEMRNDYTRRSIGGGHVQSRVKAPAGLKETWFKITSRGTKYLHVKLEGKYPCILEMSEVNAGIELSSKKSYSCKADIQWRKVRGANKAFMNFVTEVKEMK